MNTTELYETTCSDIVDTPLLTLKQMEKIQKKLLKPKRRTFWQWLFRIKVHKDFDTIILHPDTISLLDMEISDSLGIGVDILTSNLIETGTAVFYNNQRRLEEPATRMSRFMREYCGEPISKEGK